jgi:hypothetical protein
MRESKQPSKWDARVGRRFPANRRISSFLKGKGEQLNLKVNFPLDKRRALRLECLREATRTFMCFEVNRFTERIGNDREAFGPNRLANCAV